MKPVEELKRLRFYLARFTECSSSMWLDCFNAICCLELLVPKSSSPAPATTKNRNMRT